MAHNGPCFVVPPYLLTAIAESEANDHSIQECARQALEHQHVMCTRRQNVFTTLAQPRGYGSSSHQHGGSGGGGGARQGPRGIVPGSILEHLARSENVDADTRSCAQRDLDHLKALHQKVLVSQGLAGAPSEAKDKDKQGVAAPKPKTGDKTETPPAAKTTYSAVYTMSNSNNDEKLPGKMLRASGEKPVSDKAANEALDNALKVVGFYEKFFNWHSIDNQYMDIISSVHYGKKYENACKPPVPSAVKMWERRWKEPSTSTNQIAPIVWDPEARQMVYGDGATFIHNFTGTVDVIGHEITV